MARTTDRKGTGVGTGAGSGCAFGLGHSHRHDTGKRGYSQYNLGTTVDRAVTGNSVQANV